MWSEDAAAFESSQIRRIPEIEIEEGLSLGVP